jgi:hypothetical protein
MTTKLVAATNSAPATSRAPTRREALVTLADALSVAAGDVHFFIEDREVACDLDQPGRFAEVSRDLGKALVAVGKLRRKVLAWCPD